MKTLIPNLDILPQSQRDLWPALSGTPEQFVLYGGTALALRLGHRQSIDFDFFSAEEIDVEKLLYEIKYLKNAEVIDQQKNALTCLVNGVQLSFFGLHAWRHVQEPEMTGDNKIKVASLVDILATKLKVIQQRPSWKDYVDIHVILTETDITLEDGLAAGQIIYGAQFNPLVALKTLRYFGDIDEREFTKEKRVDIIKHIEQVDFDKINECVIKYE